MATSEVVESHALIETSVGQSDGGEGESEGGGGGCDHLGGKRSGTLVPDYRHLVCECVCVCMSQRGVCMHVTGSACA